MYDFVIVGGGVVGLATALAVTKRYPQARGAVLEKEADWALHQSGHNSGVIHSGIYYKPGSLKAKLCRLGSQSMVEFCQKYGINHEVCGKVIVATTEAELPLLNNLYQRGLANGLMVTQMTREEVKEIEPHVECLAGIKVPSTGIVDFAQVCQTYARLVSEQGSDLYLKAKVQNLVQIGQGWCLELENQTRIETRVVINCAGLHSDRLARLSGVNPQVKIVPFRGEYCELKPEKRYLVKNLIYPVPNLNFPFLGVHFTRMIDGTVHAGPNAVLSFKREGYHKSDFSWGDLQETLLYPGFWRLAAKYPQQGLEEMIRSWSKRAFVASLQRLIPEIQPEDIVPTHAGVRAQALRNNGQLEDDFLIIESNNSIHVSNAPSPAATSSLEIGKAIASKFNFF